MKYEIGQKVVTPLGVGQLIDTPLGSGVVEAIGDEIVYVSVCNFPPIPFPDVALKPYKTPHERLLEMGYAYEYKEMGDGLEEKWHIFHNKERRMTINVIKDNNGIGWYINFYDPFNYVANTELSRILTDYLEWLEEEK